MRKRRKKCGWENKMKIKNEKKEEKKKEQKRKNKERKQIYRKINK